MRDDTVSTTERLVAANAFRVLGLDPGADTATVLQRAGECRAYLGVGHSPKYELDIDVFSPAQRSEETIGEAVQRLQDPRTRLIDEATWLLVRPGPDAAAIRALTEGSVSRARAVWEAGIAAATSAAERLHYYHHLAVLELALATCPARSESKGPAVWQTALRSWAPLVRDARFWQSLAAASPGRQDPRWSSEVAEEARRAIAETLVSTVVRDALRVLGQGGPGEARPWIEALVTSGLEVDVIDPALTRLLMPVGEQIREGADAVTKMLKSGDGSLAVEDLKRRVEILQSVQALRERFTDAFAAVPETHSLRIAVADSIAEAYGALGNALCAPERSPREGIRILAQAREIAASDGARHRLERGLRVSQWNLAMQDFNAAMEAADTVSASQALARLEAAYEATDPEEIAQALQQCRGALERVKKAPTPPSLFTLNGWGTRIYGKASPDPATGTYTGTLFFTIFWIPVLALARYRMRDAEGGGYYFHDKTPLGQFGWSWNVIAVALLALLVLSNQNDSTAGSTSSSPSASRPVRDSSTPKSGPAESPQNPVIPQQRTPSVSEGAASMRREIDQLRAQLESNDRVLDAEKESIEIEEAVVEQLRRRIERRRALSPDGLPEEELGRDHRDVADHNGRVTTLKGRIARYNERLRAHQAEVGRFNTMVDEYNLRFRKSRR